MNCTKKPTLKTRRIKRKKQIMKARSIAVGIVLMAVCIVFLVIQIVSSLCSGLTVQAENKKSNKEITTEITEISMICEVAETQAPHVSVIQEDVLSSQSSISNEQETSVEETTEVPTEEPEEEQPIRENKLYCVIDEGNWRSDLDIEYQDFLWEKCVEYGITEYYELLLAQMYHESGFNIKTVSSTNDYGLMQINKCNHDWLAEKLGSSDFLNPYTSIEAGVLIMSEFLNKYNDVQKALVCYNRGEKAVINGTYSTSYSTEVLQDKKYLVEIDENGKEK